MKIKNILQILILSLTFISCSSPQKNEIKTQQPVKIIFDTDFGSAADDLGSLIMLNHLQNQGECTILGIMSYFEENSVIAAIDAVNTFYGNDDIPIAIKSRNYYEDTTHYNKIIADQFPHDITNADVPLAVEAYRKILSEQEDHSVVILAVAPLGNIKDLIDSKPDKYSELTGKELLNTKVKFISDMGGEYPEGKQEWNFSGNAPGVTKYVLANIDIPIIFSGAEIGDKIKIGNEFNEIDHHTPLYQGFYYCSSHAPWIKDKFQGKILDMSTYDETSVSFAIHGDNDKYWTRNSGGIFEVQDNGDCKWIKKEPSNQSYLSMTPQQRENARKYILDLMVKNLKKETTH